MNFVLTIIEPSLEGLYKEILDTLAMPVAVMMHGHGTASKSMMNLLGLESKLKRAVITVANEEDTQKHMELVRKKLFIDAPGNGISIAVPVKSVGGVKTLEFLSKGAQSHPAEVSNTYENELIVAIANEGCSEQVMDAAREAGAVGGTVLHGKGTGKTEYSRFYNMSITGEKEVIIIVTKASVKAAIMSAIIKNAGPATEAGTVVFSLPVSHAMGMAMLEK